MTLPRLLSHLLPGLAYVLLAPVMVGLLRQMKARVQGRRGPAVLQCWRNLVKWLGKRPVVPDSASSVFAAAPVVAFTCYAVLGFLAPPLFLLPADTRLVSADLLIVVYLMGLARLAIGLAGLDAGSPFASLGSSRDLFVHVITEPALLFWVFALALRWQTTDLSSILTRMQAQTPLRLYADPGSDLMLLALFLAILAEAGRLPFDNPETKLELTMFGKGVHQEYSGPYLALLEWADWLRLTFLLMLLAGLAVPHVLVSLTQGPAQIAVHALAYGVVLYLLLLGLACFEGVQIKTRIRAVVPAAMSAMLLAVFGALLIGILPL